MLKLPYILSIEYNSIICIDLQSINCNESRAISVQTNVITKAVYSLNSS